MFSEAWNDDADDVTVVPVGLWQRAESASDVSIQSTLDDQAAGDLAYSGVLIPSYTLGLRPGTYHEGFVNMGDTVPLVIRSGRLDVTGSVRVVGFAFDIGEDGAEDVTLSVGRPLTSLVDMMRRRGRRRRLSKEIAMARLTPLWQQALTYPARLDRQLLGAVWPGGGVIGGAVTAVANTMGVSVAPGTAAVPLAAGNGGALCTWDAPEPVTLAAAPGSGTSRIDLIVVQVRDPDLDAGANGDFIVTAVKGIAAAFDAGAKDEASAFAGAPPAVPANALAICQVLVPGAAANLNTATISQRAQRLGTDPAWITLALINGWTVNDTPQYRRINGMVYVRGGMSGTLGQIAFTLPLGYRPAAQQTFFTRCSSSSNVGCSVAVKPDGTVTANATGLSGTQYVALYGIVFDADQ